jgi:hypothetical protein
VIENFTLDKMAQDIEAYLTECSAARPGGRQNI